MAAEHSSAQHSVTPSQLVDADNDGMIWTAQKPQVVVSLRAACRDVLAAWSGCADSISLRSRPDRW